MKRWIPLLSSVLIFLTALLTGCAGKVEEISKAQGIELPTVIICSIDSTGDVTDSSYQVYEYQGKRYVFSSEACRSTIASDPEKYLGGK